MITQRLHTARLATVLASIFVVSTASASPNYPEELRAALNLYYTPSCTLCHSSGAGPVDTPFGKSMVARGLLGEGDSDAGTNSDAGTINPTLLAALARMRADGVDSDGDGAEDLDELSWGGDPNHYDGLHPTNTQEVHYGCQLGAHSHSNSTLVLAILGAVLFGVRRRLRPRTL